MNEERKALVPYDITYATSIEHLCSATADIGDFFKNTEDYDLVLFTGGSDISPKLYGETSPLGRCHIDPARDLAEKEIFEHALEHGVKIAGICRGLQLITALCGGKLIHHLDNHNNTTHTFSTFNYEKPIRVNSLHHQMCIPPEDAFIVGWSDIKLSNIYYGDRDLVTSWDGPEVEALIFPRQLCAGVQYHPEMMRKNSEGYQWFWVFMFDFLAMSMESFVNTYTEGETHAFSQAT